MEADGAFPANLIVVGRFGHVALEDERVEAVLTRRPMLFEPDIALNSHLLRYQERVKLRVSSWTSEDSLLNPGAE